VTRIVLHEVQPPARDRLVTIITHKRPPGRPREYHWDRPSTGTERNRMYRERKQIRANARVNSSLRQDRGVD